MKNKPCLKSKKQIEESYKKLEECIKNGKLNNLNPNEICKEIESYLPNNMIICQPWGLEFNTIKLYRCTKNYPDIDINSTSSFGYPPIEYMSLQRCNLEYQQVLYLSFDRKTTIHESQTKENEVVYVSEWTLDIKDDIKIYEYPFFNMEEKIDNNSYASIYIESLNKKMNEILSELNKRDRELIHINRCYQDLFRKNGQEYYNVTSALCDNIFNNKNLNIDFISYPSISTDMNSINFVFKKDSADKFLKIRSVLKGKMTKIDKNKDLEFILSDVGINEGNIIKWKSLIDIQKDIIVTSNSKDFDNTEITEMFNKLFFGNIDNLCNLESGRNEWYLLLSYGKNKEHSYKIYFTYEITEDNFRYIKAINKNK